MKSKQLLEIVDELRELRYTYDACSIGLLKVRNRMDYLETMYTKALEYEIRNHKEELIDDES